MDSMNRIERRLERLEKQLLKVAAHSRALEKVVESVIGEASKRAFEFAVKQYEWQQMNERHQ